MQLSIFDKPKAACEPTEGQKIKYAIKEADLSGLTIKDQFDKLVAVSCGPSGGAGFQFQSMIGSKGFDYWDARHNWIDLPDYLRDNVCEMFDLSTFPINPAPMERPAPPVPWYESMMDKPDASEFTKKLPRDDYVILATGNPYVKPQERYKLGPFQTCFPRGLPLEDRAKVRDFMRLHPHLNVMIDVYVDESQRRVMPEETKIKIRLLNMMRRAVKKYGMFAEEFARQECLTRGWEWSDESWQRANTPPKKSKVQHVKRKKKGRSTDNDSLMVG